MKDGNSGLVVISITVIRRGEDSQGERSIMFRHLVFVALAIHFMSPYDQTELITLQESLTLGRTVEIAAASQLIILKSVRGGIDGVTPQQIAHRLSLRYLHKTVDPLNFI